MKKLSFKEKLGYASGSLGDAIAYGFIGTYLMFFLTTICKIEPATAGSITVVGAVWNALFNPLMGYFSDRIRTRFGQRRPLILAFSLPLAFSMLMLFTAFDIPASVKPIYYGFMLMLFWSSYTGYFVPYLALGAEYTSDYQDRTVLRLFASFFNMLGTMCSMVLPTVAADFLQGLGLTLAGSWSCVGGILGIIAALSIIITVIASKRKDPPCSLEIIQSSKRNREPFSLKKIFAEYISVAKLSPVKYLIFASLFSLIAYEMIMADMVYFFTFNQGFASGRISFFIMLRAIMGIIFIPIVGKITAVLDKRMTLITFNILGAAGMIMLKITGIQSTLSCCLYILFVSVCTCIYWQLMPSIFYDICEYDRVETRKHRDGTIVSFQGLVEAVAVGLGSQILGIVLQLAGFKGEAAIQSPLALEWIENATTWIPVIFLLLASIALYKYPITREYHAKLRQTLSDRENK